MKEKSQRNPKKWIGMTCWIQVLLNNHRSRIPQFAEFQELLGLVTEDVERYNNELPMINARRRDYTQLLGLLDVMQVSLRLVLLNWLCKGTKWWDAIIAEWDWRYSSFGSPPRVEQTSRQVMHLVAFNAYVYTESTHLSSTSLDWWI